MILDGDRVEVLNAAALRRKIGLEGEGVAGPPGAPGAPGAPGQGVPTGGTTNQVLTKDSNTDFDTSWQTPAAGGGAPADAEYLVAAANGTLSAERVTTDTATVAWDHATAAQAKANVIPAGIKLDDLGAPDDNTDLDVSITKHGLAPKAPNDATKYLDGTGAYSVPPGGSGAPTGAEYLVATADAGLSAERVTTNTPTVSWDHSVAAQAKANVIPAGIKLDDLGAPDDNIDLNATSLAHGLLPKLSGNASDVFKGDGTFGAGGGSGTVTNTGALTADQVVVGNGSSDVKILAGPSDATRFLNGAAVPAFAAVKDSDLSTSDITTNNVASTKHGFAPKSPADATQFLNGAAAPAFALVKDSDLSTSDITTNNATIAKHGFCPKLSNNATQYLDGGGNFSVPGGTTFWTQIIVKSVDQDVTNSTTLTNDTELVFAVVAGEVWFVQLYLVYSGNHATSDYKFNWGLPTVTGWMRYVGDSQTGDTVHAVGLTRLAGATAITDIAPGTDAAFTPRTGLYEMMFRAAASADCQFKFANNAAAAGRTSRTEAGTTLMARKFL